MAKNSNTESALREELSRLGAREFEIVALTMEPKRGLAALAYAQSKGAEHPIAYATKMFDNPDWQPSGERVRHETNQSVDVECVVCGGDRFVLAEPRHVTASMWMREKGIEVPPGAEIEEMKPCPECGPRT